MSTKISFVAVGMLVLYSCSSVSTLEMMDGRMHNVTKTSLIGIPVHTQAEVVKTDAELAQESKEATASLKMEMERLVALANADAESAKAKTKAFETRVGSLTKLGGFALIALGFIMHCFVSGSTLRSVASSTIAGGFLVVLTGVGIKAAATWELWLLGALLVAMLPTLYFLRNKGLGKAKEPKDIDDEQPS